MTIVLNSIKVFNRSLDDVTKLCLVASVGCFFSGAALQMAAFVFPIGPRGVALYFVGLFFLAHGLFELGKNVWLRRGARRAWPLRPADRNPHASDFGEPQTQAAA